MYSTRSERVFYERLNDDVLFKWFLDVRIDQPAFDSSTCSKNRQRLLDADVQWHGEMRSRDTHRSTTDPEACLARTSFGTPAKMSYAGHLLAEPA